MVSCAADRHTPDCSNQFGYDDDDKINSSSDNLFSATTTKTVKFNYDSCDARHTLMVQHAEAEHAAVAAVASVAPLITTGSRHNSESCKEYDSNAHHDDGNGFYWRPSSS